MDDSQEPMLAEVVEPVRKSIWTDLSDNTWLLLATLFLVTGAIGIPLIFYSTRLSIFQKILLTIVVSIYTLILIGGAGWAVYWAWSVISGL